MGEGVGAYANGSDMAGEGVGAYAGGAGSVWSAGVGAYESGGGRVLQSIIRNPSDYIAISIVLNRKASYYVIAKKWLKQTYIMNGREREGEKRG